MAEPTAVRRICVAGPLFSKFCCSMGRDGDPLIFSLGGSPQLPAMLPIQFLASGGGALNRQYSGLNGQVSQFTVRRIIEALPVEGGAMLLDLAFDLAHTLDPRDCERYDRNAGNMASVPGELCSQRLQEGAYRRLRDQPNCLFRGVDRRWGVRHSNPPDPLD